MIEKQMNQTESPDTGAWYQTIMNSIEHIAGQVTKADQFVNEFKDDFNTDLREAQQSEYDHQGKVFETMGTLVDIMGGIQYSTSDSGMAGITANAI